MKLEGAKLTLSIRDDEVFIEIRDGASSTTFFDGRILSQDLMAALGRLAFVPFIEANVKHLDRVGKKMEMKRIEFPIPSDANNLFYQPHSSTYHNEIGQLAQEYVPEGWTLSDSFRSQNSFFYKDDGQGKQERWARATIRRWVSAE